MHKSKLGQNFSFVYSLSMEYQEVALNIVKKLKKSGYIAYFAGGWVRDYVMGNPSCDIDIATNALPCHVLSLFNKTLSIGVSFGIVIVVEKGHSFEVATFRRDVGYRDGRHPNKVEYTESQEDAKRRDFTINGMFYDPIEKKIIDYVGGIQDIRKGVIQTIGDPNKRFLEDRLRMMRAIRFAARFSFYIDPKTEDAILQQAHTLFPAVAKERIWQELDKMTQYPNTDCAFIDLHRLGLFSIIFPRLKNVSLEVIRDRVKSFWHFPKGCPALFYILELFPDCQLEELILIFTSLKVSNQQIKLLKLAFNSKNILIKNCDDPVTLVNFYASPFSTILVEVYAFQFKEKHEKQKTHLMPHIVRCAEKKTLVTSSHLKAKGVKPGKEMGALLAKSEQIAIEQDLHDPEFVLKQMGF